MVVSASRLDIYSHLFEGDHRHHVQRLDDPQEDVAVLIASMPESATQAQPLLVVREDRSAEAVDD